MLSLLKQPSYAMVRLHMRFKGRDRKGRGERQKNKQETLPTATSATCLQARMPATSPANRAPNVGAHTHDWHPASYPEPTSRSQFCSHRGMATPTGTCHPQKHWKKPLPALASPWVFSAWLSVCCPPSPPCLPAEHPCGRERGLLTPV